ncbi:MAG: EAL domain-containing protein [Huintestinicola sp.]
MGKINHNAFLTEMVKFASLDENPDIIISKLLQFICEKLDSDRAYIFEQNENGTFDNTFEFCREGVTAEKDNLQGLPYENIIEVWYNEFRRSKNMLIYDIEEYKAVSEDGYNILKPQGIGSIVAGPIVENGEYIGFYGVDNPPKEAMADISELLNMIEYIISMMIRIRKYALCLRDSSETDPLTGCRNRKAMDSRYSSELSGEIGLLMCDLNGLKVKNDSEGHLAGDKYICDLADVLMEIFGKDKVYRLGGDEFLAVKSPVTEDTMISLTEEVLEKCRQRDVSVSVGMEFSDSSDVSFERLLQAADKKMYSSKRAYYSSQKVDRRAKKEIKSDVLNNILFEAFAEASDNVYIYMLDMGTGRSRWSKNCVEYFGIPSEYPDNSAEMWQKHVHPDDREMYLADISRVFAGEASKHACQYRALNRYGEYVWVECKGKVTEGTNGSPVFAGLITRLDNQNIYDSLTGLKTKSQFYGYDFTEEEGMVLLLGVDKFKNVINTYGYENGDKVLVQIGKALMRVNNNSCRVYRFTGDEFVFVLPGGTEESVRELFGRICGMVETVTMSNGAKIELSLSGGAAKYPLQSKTVDELVNHLELALLHVKKENRGSVGFYSEETEERQKRYNLLKQDLKQCITDNFKGFELYYQPWMNSKGDMIVGCEALLRWKGDIIKDSYPGEFIPILEESDDIIEVGRFVMQEAMKQQKEWEDKFGEVIVSFNVSYTQFHADNYVREIDEAAKRFGVDPSHMVIELTESCNVKDPEVLADVFNKLRELGFRIVLDDFGTGYASLEMIKMLPADGIKIEHNFVRELANEGHDIDFAIIKSILLLCREIGQHVVVEGVENQEVDEIIRSMNSGTNAGYLQGYYYSKPIRKQEFEYLLSGQNNGG